MTLLLSAVLAASTVKSVGAVIAVLSVIAVVVYAVVNIRSGRDEVASEIELAANRKPYYDDETMEGPRLERALSMGLVLLPVVAVGLPLYWLHEPWSQAGAVENFDTLFVKSGPAPFAPRAVRGSACPGGTPPAGDAAPAPTP